MPSTARATVTGRSICAMWPVRGQHQQPAARQQARGPRRLAHADQPVLGAPHHQRRRRDPARHRHSDRAAGTSQARKIAAAAVPSAVPAHGTELRSSSSAHGQRRSAPRTPASGRRSTGAASGRRGPARSSRPAPARRLPADHTAPSPAPSAGRPAGARSGRRSGMAGETRVSVRTRSGVLAASSSAMAPPIELPNRCTGLAAAPSSIAAPPRRPARPCGSRGLAGGGDRPKPGRSTASPSAVAGQQAGQLGPVGRRAAEAVQIDGDGPAGPDRAFPGRARSIRRTA